MSHTFGSCLFVFFCFVLIFSRGRGVDKDIAFCVMVTLQQLL